MPPQAGLIGAALVWNYRRDRAGLPTLSQFCRAHPLVFVVGWAALNVWFVPHVLTGSHLTDRSIRLLDGLRR